MLFFKTQPAFFPPLRGVLPHVLSFSYFLLFIVSRHVKYQAASIYLYQFRGCLDFLSKGSGREMFNMYQGAHGNVTSV
jgi:hypothetical protein